MPTSLSSSAKRNVRGPTRATTRAARSGSRLTLERPLEALITSSAGLGRDAPVLTKRGEAFARGDHVDGQQGVVDRFDRVTRAHRTPHAPPWRRNAFTTSVAVGIHLASPPSITVSFPASAPDVPPLTGASTKPTPFLAKSAAVLRDVAGSPDVASINSWPCFHASLVPVTMERTSLDVGKTRDHERRPSESLRAASPPPWRASPCRTPWPCRPCGFHTIVSNRLATCAAMGRPNGAQANESDLLDHLSLPASPAPERPNPGLSPGGWQPSLPSQPPKPPQTCYPNICFPQRHDLSPQRSIHDPVAHPYDGAAPEWAGSFAQVRGSLPSRSPPKGLLVISSCSFLSAGLASVMPACTRFIFTSTRARY